MDQEALTARVMAACQLLKENGYEDVAGLLAAVELRKRKGERKPRQKQVPNASVVDRLTGRPVAGSRFYFEEKERA